MSLKGTLLIIFALFIDGLQAMVSLTAFTLGTALQAITPLGGGTAGAAAGAYLCWNSAGGVLSGIVGAAKCTLAGGVLGAAVSAFGVPFGIALGFALNICISLTFGAGLILLLMLMGMFYPKYAWGGTIFELMPGLDLVPGWTLMVILSLIQKNSEGSGAISKVTGLATAAGNLSFTNPVSAFRSSVTLSRATQGPMTYKADNDEQAPETAPQERTRIELKSPSINGDVAQKRRTPANDNLPYAQAA